MVSLRKTFLGCRCQSNSCSQDRGSVANSLVLGIWECSHLIAELSRFGITFNLLFAETVAKSLRVVANLDAIFSDRNVRRTFTNPAPPIIVVDPLLPPLQL